MWHHRCVCGGGGKGDGGEGGWGGGGEGRGCRTREPKASQSCAARKEGGGGRTRFGRRGGAAPVPAAGAGGLTGVCRQGGGGKREAAVAVGCGISPFCSLALSPPSSPLPLHPFLSTTGRAAVSGGRGGGPSEAKPFPRERCPPPFDSFLAPTPTG